MKRLFLYLLKRYTRREAGRLEVQQILQEQVENDYTEQTRYGNVYNGHIEFLMANSLVNELVKNEDRVGIIMIKQGLESAFHNAIDYIKK